MKTHALGTTGVTVSSVVLGLMRIKTMSDAEIRDLFTAARSVGINMIDHADIYGGERHLCEKRFGDAVSLTATEREEVLIQSKVGIRKGFFDFSKEHILASVDGSLKALKTDYLDVLLLHRPDALVEPEDVAAAFDEWKKGGWPTPRREIMFGARPQDWTIGLDEVLDEIVSAEEGRRETIRRIGSGEILAGKRNLTAEKTKKILDGAKNDVIMAHDRIESYLAGVEWAFGEPGIEKMIERLQGEGAWPLEADLPIQGRPTPERVWK